MSQEKFAAEIGVSFFSTVRRWENAHHEPSRLSWRAVWVARRHGLGENAFLGSGPAHGE